MPSSRPRFRPALELLESRLPFDVSAVQVGSDLWLTGDKLANWLQITGDGPGNFAVQAVGENLNGVRGATLHFSGITNIRMWMGNDDDVVHFYRSHLAGALQFFGGDGADTLWFGQALHEDQSFGQIFASLGAGPDTLGTANENSLTVEQSFVVLGGDGLNTISLETDTSVSLGNVVVVGGRDSDFVTFTQGLIRTKSLRFHGGSGYNRLHLQGDSTIDGSVIATGGDEQDVFYMGEYARGNSTISGSMLLVYGEGNSDVGFFGSTHFGGPVRHIAGADDDEFVSYNNFETPQNNQFAAGDIDLRLGEGDNLVSFSQGHSDMQRLSVQTGGGVDRVTLFNTTVAGEMLLNAGDGNNYLVVVNSTFWAPVSWTLGNGADDVFLEAGYAHDNRSTVFHAAFAFQLGAGDDELLMGSRPDLVSFLDEVVLDGGEGDDRLLEFVTIEYVVPPVIVGFE